MTSTRMRAILALLLVATAVLFAIGTAIERSTADSHSEPAATADHGEHGTESAGEENGGEVHAATETAKAESGTKLFGIDTESIGAIAVGVVASLVLAAAVRFRRERIWLWLTLAFGLVFAAGDAREVVHQANESRTGLAVVAATLLVVHLAIAWIAWRLASSDSQPARVAGTSSAT